MRPPRWAVVWTAILAFTMGVLVLVDQGAEPTEGRFSPGSVFNESEDGLSAAFRYLEERGAEPAVTSRRPSSAILPQGAVLFRIQPRLVPFPADEDMEEDTDEEVRPWPLLTRTEEEWARAGGRLVLALDADYGPLGIRDGLDGGPVRKAFPLWPGVDTLDLGEVSRAAYGRALESAHTVFAQGRDPLLSRFVVGRGEILLLAAPELLHNAHLAQADHLALLEALAGSGRPVLFDEWTHGLGQDEGLLELLLEWRLGPALLVASLAFALGLWRGRSRIGPAEDDAMEERSEAVDLVDSLAQLYDRALTRREAATLHLEGFRKAVGLRSGLRGAALERRTRELLGSDFEAPSAPGGKGEIPPSEFLRTLNAVNDGYRRLHEHAHTRRRP